MTDKQMNKLADIVAEKVINKLVAKQKEWDKEFNEQFETIEYFEKHPPKLSVKAKLELEMADLTKIRSTYIMTEKYELVEEIEKKIINLQKRINNL